MFDWFWEFLYSLLKTVLYCIDFLMLFANKLVGVEPVYDQNRQEVDLLNFFFTSETILDAFKYVALIGIVLMFLFTAFAVVRSIARMGEGRSPLGVCANAAKSILYFLMIPAIMIIGGLFVSAIMTSIYRATLGGGTSLGSSMFTLFADEAYNGGGNKEQILEQFRAGGPFVEDSGGFNYYSMGNVKNYFSLSKVNYFLGFVVGIAVLIMLVLPMLSFVERIVSLVLLFIVSPISVASSVLDEGMRFKLWRDQVINKFIIAYGSIISLNIFILLVGVIYEINFFQGKPFLNGLARMLFVLGGAFACRMGTVLIGNLVNHGAGSQYAQDLHNLTGTAFHAGAPVVGATTGILGAVGRAGRAAGGKAVGGISSAIGKARGGKSPVGTGKTDSGSDAGRRFNAKVQSNPATTRARSGAVGEKVGAARGKNANPFHTKPGGTGIPPAQNQRTIQDVLLGSKAGGDNAMNKEGAATLKDAMKSGGKKI